MWPDGPTFAPCQGPIITADSRELDVARQQDPATYSVEYEAQWATVSDRYLPISTVDAIFAALPARRFDRLTNPIYGADYAVHIDLSLSGDNTALVLAHSETLDDTQHVVVDQIVHWDPHNNPNGQIDYDEVADTAINLAVTYDARISLDQYQSVSMIDKITQRQSTIRQQGLTAALGRPTVIDANHSEKLTRWEQTKTLAAEGRLHAPFDKLLRDELDFLRRVEHRIAAPTSGPVTTDDAADALSHVVTILMRRSRPAKTMGELRVAGGPLRSGPHPIDEAAHQAHPSRPTNHHNPARGIHRQEYNSRFPLRRR